jgi:hypothetical protein
VPFVGSDVKTPAFAGPSIHFDGSGVGAGDFVSIGVQEPSQQDERQEGQNEVFGFHRGHDTPLVKPSDTGKNKIFSLAGK